MLVRRGLVHLVDTIRWRPQISMAPEFNHAFSTDLTAVLCLFQMVVPIAGSRLLVKHFQRINTGFVAWLGCEDGSNIALCKNSILFFLSVLFLLDFSIVFMLHRFLMMGI